MKKALSFLLAITLCASMTACAGVETNSAISSVDTQSMLNGIYTVKTNETPNTGGVDSLAYTSPMNNEYLFVEDRLMDYVGEESFKEWTESESEKGTYKFTVNVLAYIDHFDLTKEQFTEACFVVPHLPLYTTEEIDVLYGSDIEEVLKYVKNDGAIFSNGELYSAEWLNISTVEQFLLEKIDISELKNSQAETTEVINYFAQNNTRSATSYEDKIAEYETLIAD